MAQHWTSHLTNDAPGKRLCSYLSWISSSKSNLLREPQRQPMSCQHFLALGEWVFQSRMGVGGLVALHIPHHNSLPVIAKCEGNPDTLFSP